ncbi:MAG: hypothetical protein KC422_25975 [Trueperaceae bacterium]|nr:hypothetical protein [Trueperaceae bacterium]
MWRRFTVTFLFFLLMVLLTACSGNSPGTSGTAMWDSAKWDSSKWTE